MFFQNLENGQSTVQNFYIWNRYNRMSGPTPMLLHLQVLLSVCIPFISVCTTPSTELSTFKVRVKFITTLWFNFKCQIRSYFDDALFYHFCSAEGFVIWKPTCQWNILSIKPICKRKWNCDVLRCKLWNISAKIASNKDLD